LLVHALAGAPERVLVDRAELIVRAGLGLGVDPHRREQLPPRTLVLHTRLEALEEPPVDVLAAHLLVGIGSPAT
jgi:hypothetical protein